MTDSAAARPALISAVACYTLWGFLPLLFMGQAAAGFDSFEILAHRALWAVAVAGLLVWLAKQGGQVRAVLTSPKTLAWLAFSTMLIAVNWGVYVWATTHGATLEASLGYYINPLLNMVVGLWLFREKIDRWGWIAIGLAAVGVLFQALALGRPPWISIILAISFATYGVIRKRVPIDAQAGLLVECLLLLPFGLAWVLWLQHTGAGVAFDSPVNTLWALANGPATVLQPQHPGETERDQQQAFDQQPGLGVDRHPLANDAIGGEADGEDDRDPRRPAEGEGLEQHPDGGQADGDPAPAVDLLAE